MVGAPRPSTDSVLNCFISQGWIFCVDLKLFTNALFEYYVDHLHSKFTTPPLDSDEPAEELSAEALSERQEDLWTLDYISRHGHSVNKAVDRDASGWIRISKVNAFTNSIPEGWSLPQWLAYVAIGT